MKKKFQNDVLRFCRQEQMFSSGIRLLVGVSGGADSVALLHLLAATREKTGIKLFVAHLNHNLRGKSAAADCAFVGSLAKELSLPFESGSARVKLRAQNHKLSIEAAARAARHDFFRRCVRKYKADAVALAHNADDQAETFLLRLLRGSGMNGLSAMTPVCNVGGLKIIRPLLKTSREKIEEYLCKDGLAWCEDQSNSSREHTRNRVRHILLPLLEREFDASVRSILRRTAEIMRDDNELLEKIGTERMVTLLNAEKGLDLSGLREQPRALQRRILRCWIKFTMPGFQPVFNDIEAIRRFVSGYHASGFLQLPDERRIQIVYDRLYCEGRQVLHRSKADKKPHGPVRVAVPRTGTVRWSLGRLMVHTWTGPGVWKDTPPGAGCWPCRATINPTAAGRRRFWLRTRLPGDRFLPLNMKGSRKIQDIFTDERVPVAVRDNIPLLVCGDEIVWVPGYRVARGWEVKTPSSPSMHIVIESTKGTKQ